MQRVSLGLIFDLVIRRRDHEHRVRRVVEHVAKRSAEERGETVDSFAAAEHDERGVLAPSGVQAIA